MCRPDQLAGQATGRVKKKNRSADTMLIMVGASTTARVTPC
jgi:hypothetical protein